MNDLIDLLTRVDEFLDNYVDVDDGDDGRPVANRAMSLQTDVREALARLERATAAAPDLLAALVRSRGQWIHSVNAPECLAAIAKAEAQS